MNSMHTAWAANAMDGVQASYPTGQPFAVTLNGLLYAAHLSLAAQPRGLLVQLWSAPGATGARPMLSKPDLGRGFNFHTLTISDPSLFLDDNLETGVFLGERGNDPLVGVEALSRSVAQSLAVDTEHVVFTGLSSGGFAAVMAACRMGVGAIAINPQLVLPAIRRAPAAPILLERFEPGMDPDRLGQEAPERAIASFAYQSARRSGLAPKLSIFQNVNDEHHYRKHFIPFCADLGLGARGGVSKDRGVAARSMDYAEAHSVPYEVRKLATIEGLSFLYPRSAKEARKSHRLSADSLRQYGFSPAGDLEKR